MISRFQSPNPPLLAEALEQVFHALGRLLGRIADGIDRRLGNGKVSFNLGGRRVPTIGNICMDMCMLDVTGVPANVGDTVTIFGEDPTVSELASILGTIPYEIMTSVPRRIERIITGR